MASSLYHTLMNTPDLRLVLDRVEKSLEQERAQREAFYEWLTPSMKAEFINGEVIMHSPAKRGDLRVTKRLFTLLETLVELKDLGEVDVEKALVVLTRNDYEPDICFWRKEVADQFDDDTMRHPAPDLVVEVLSKTTEFRDRGIKFQDYAAHGVKEYWIIDPYQQTVEPFELDAEFMTFETQPVKSIKDRLSSQVVAGFDIPIRAIFEREAYQTALTGLMNS